MNLDTFPIAAIATAPGRGGIGVVRASGKNLRPLAEALFHGVRRYQRSLKAVTAVARQEEEEE